MDMWMDICTDNHVDMCIDVCGVLHVYRHMYRHVCRYMHRHVYRYVDGHVYRHVCCHGSFDVYHWAHNGINERAGVLGWEATAQQSHHITSPDVTRQKWQ